MEEPRPWRAAVLAMLVLALAVSSGCCNLDYVPNHDIVVLKLASDGALEWTRVVDHGSDDTAGDLVELPDGGYGIAGQTSDRRYGPPRPLLVRLSPDGAVVWERSVTDGLDVARAIVSAGDGGTAVLTGNGTVVRFDPDGSALWARATGIPEAYALVSTADGGYLAGGRIMYEVPVNNTAATGTAVRRPVITTETGAGGPVLAEAVSRPTTPVLAQVPRRFDLVRRAMVVRLDSDGAIEWERQYDEGVLTGVEALGEGRGGSGFLLVGEGPSSPNQSYSTPLLALTLTPDGTPGEITPLAEPPSWPWSVLMRSDDAGFRVLFQPTRISQENYYRGVEDVLLAPDGSVLEQRGIDASLAVTWTTAGGYFSIGVPSGGNGTYQGPSACGVTGICTYSARTFDSHGAVVADRTLSAAPFDQVKKVVQTVDGGYAVLGLRQNR